MSKKKPKIDLDNVTLADIAKWARKYKMHISVVLAQKPEDASAAPEEPAPERAKAEEE